LPPWILPQDPCGKHDEGLGIARLRRLAGAGMGALRAVVPGGRVDAVTFLQMLCGHLGHVVFDDLRHFGGGRLRHGHLHREREANGGGKGGNSGHTVHGGAPVGGLIRETDNNRFAPERRKVTGVGWNKPAAATFYPV
jgi:hypothetical protein